jgi:predicted ATP-grasp superfamily ATP-dependent carboligase
MHERLNKPVAFVMTHESDASRTNSRGAMSIIALTLTRSLGRAGIDVVRIHPNLFDPSLDSKYCRAVEVCPNLYTSESALTDYLAGLKTKYPGKHVLIPASDDCCLYMARNEQALREHFLLLNPNGQTLQKLKTKRLQYELAEASGVPIPETYFPEDEAQVLTLADGLRNYPYVIKPTEAHKWRLAENRAIANGKKAVTVHSADELLAEYRRISAHDNDLMIQEIIEGDDTQLFTFISYRSEQTSTLAFCIRSKLRQKPAKFGYCTASVTCHNDIVEAQSKRLLEASGFSGISGVEFKFDARTGLYKLIEINTRPMNTLGIATGCGVDLPVIAYNDVVGIQQQPSADWRDGTVWVWWEQDYQAAKELRSRGLLSYREWFESLRGERVHAILASDDQRPVWRYYSGEIPRLLLNVIKSNLGSWRRSAAMGMGQLRRTLGSSSVS